MLVEIERTGGSLEVLQHSDQPQTAEANQATATKAEEERKQVREHKLKKYEDQARVEQQYQAVILSTLTVVLQRLEELQATRLQQQRMLRAMLRLMGLVVGTPEAQEVVNECLEELD